MRDGVTGLISAMVFATTMATVACADYSGGSGTAGAGGSGTGGAKSSGGAATGGSSGCPNGTPAAATSPEPGPCRRRV